MLGVFDNYLLEPIEHGTNNNLKDKYIKYNCFAILILHFIVSNYKA